MSNHQKVIDHFKKEQGIVPFNQQSPEQREEFIGRVKILNAASINLGLIQDNWPYIASAIPDKKIDPRLHAQYKKLNETLKNYLADAKMFNSIVMNMLVVNDESKLKVETYAWYNKEIINHLLRIPSEKSDLALQMIHALAGDEIKAESNEDYESKMIAFGRHCMSLSKSGRKFVTKKDLQTFLNKK